MMKNCDTKDVFNAFYRFKNKKVYILFVFILD